MSIYSLTNILFSKEILLNSIKWIRARGVLPKVYKKILTIIIINFAKVDEGREGGGISFIPFLWINCRLYRDPALSYYVYNEQVHGLNYTLQFRTEYKIEY